MRTKSPQGDSLGQDSGLFDGGPPLKLQEWLGLIKPGQPYIARRTVLAVLIGWLPLAVLTAARDISTGQDALASFLSDFGVHARCLITVPAFIWAEAFLGRRLGAIAQHFLDAGLVTDADRPRFEAAQLSILRWRDSIAVEALVIVLAYASILALMLSVPSVELPTWHEASGDRSGSFSAAGWWHGLVSLPLLAIQILGWMWRLLLWTRFLWLTSRLDLRLVPSHPDGAAGLMFVGHSVRACGVIGFALGAVVAGRVANGVALRGASLVDYRYPVLGLVIFVVVLCSGPLLMFAGKLAQQWRRGVFEYGALADGLGRWFETKWSQRQVDEEALQASDFSAATDLYQVVANVYEMRLVPIDRRSVLFLVVFTLLPFVPVLLLAVPLDKLFSEMANLLF